MNMNTASTKAAMIPKTDPSITGSVAEDNFSGRKEFSIKILSRTTKLKVAINKGMF